MTLLDKHRLEQFEAASQDYAAQSAPLIAELKKINDCFTQPFDARIQAMADSYLYRITELYGRIMKDFIQP